MAKAKKNCSSVLNLLLITFGILVHKARQCWFGVLHHVCGEHQCGLGECQHEQLTADEPKTYLEKSSEVLESLRQVICDKKLVGSLHYYTKFRHTSYIESFNSMLTK
eukprot:gene10163-18831_t